MTKLFHYFLAFSNFLNIAQFEDFEDRQKVIMTYDQSTTMLFFNLRIWILKNI